MKLGRLSTFTRESLLSDWSSRTRLEIEKYRYEATTGRHYQMSEDLGYKIGSLTDIANQRSAYQSYKDSNVLLSSKLDFLQKSIDTLFTSGKDKKSPFEAFAEGLLAAADTGKANKEAMKISADSLMRSLTTTMNGVFTDRYVFGGQNDQQPPLKDMNKALEAIKAEYKKFLGNKKPSEATASDIKKFLTSKEFNKFFEGAEWKKHFSNAQDGRVTTRIDESGETLPANSSLNIFKETIKTIMMVEVTYDSKMPREASEALATIASKNALGKASLAIQNEKMELGAAQNRVKQIQDFYDVRIKILNNADADLGGVNQEEATIHEQGLENSLQISLQLTARLSKLSLLNYL